MPSPAPAPKAQAAPEPLKAQKAPDAPVSVEKDYAMTYTERVMQQAATATAVKNLTEEGYEKMIHEGWLTESADQIAHRPAPVEHRPAELRGEILLPQPLASPIRGWIDGLTPPVKKEGRTIELSLPGVVGLFKWTLLAENRHAKRSPRTRSGTSRSIKAGNRESEQQMVQAFLDLPWPCAAATLRLIQMCDLCENGMLQLPALCPWCSAQVTVTGHSLYMQLLNYTAHVKDAASCVGMCTAVLDQWNVVKDQAVPVVKNLLSDTDKMKADQYCSDYAAIYISVSGHRQWPSLLIHFISTLICNAREAFVQEMIALRKKQSQTQADGVDVDVFPNRDWSAKVKWYKNNTQPRAGPPKERVDSLLSTTPIFKAAMTGGVAQVEICQCETLRGLASTGH